MLDPQEWADAHTDELHEALDGAGASRMMHELVDVRVDCRHSVLETIHQFAQPSDDSTVSGAVETAKRLGGGFFQKVWNGNVLAAFKHADNNNQHVIAEAYDISELLRRADTEMEKNIVRERYPGGEQVNITPL